MTKLSFRISRRVLIIASLVILFGGSIAGAYYTGLQNGKNSEADKSAKAGGEEAAKVEPNQAKEELDTQNNRIFEEYKKQIAENKLEGNEKTTLYVNAAISGAAIKAPESADYAKQALSLMSNEMKRSAGSSDLIGRLEKIASGNYN